MKEKIIRLSESQEFKLLGISSKLSMHKISWLLNQELNFDFHRLDEMNEKDSDIAFSVYQHENDTAIFSLIENKSQKGILIKKLNTIDYLLKIEGEFTKYELEQILKKIRQTSGILACLNIDLSVLKKRDIDLLS